MFGFNFTFQDIINTTIIAYLLFSIFKDVFTIKTQYWFNKKNYLTDYIEKKEAKIIKTKEKIEEAKQELETLKN